MKIEEDVPTSVGQAHDGALADLRIMRRPENVTEANLAEVFAVYLQGKALYCFDDKHWYLWNGQRWQKDKQNRCTQVIYCFDRCHDALDRRMG